MVCYNRTVMMNPLQNQGVIKMDSKEPCHEKEATSEASEREIFDVMRNENFDFIDNIFIFRNVLIAAVILAAAILICYQLGAL